MDLAGDRPCDLEHRRGFEDPASRPPHRTAIIAPGIHGLSNRPTESVNTKLRLITRYAYGFKSTDNLSAFCYLDRGGYSPDLPANEVRMTHGSDRGCP